MSTDISYADQVRKFAGEHANPFTSRGCLDNLDDIEEIQTVNLTINQLYRQGDLARRKNEAGRGYEYIWHELAFKGFEFADGKKAGALPPAAFSAATEPKGITPAPRIEYKDPTPKQAPAPGDADTFAEKLADASQNHCELLLGAAERFGIDAAAVKRQMEAPAAPKKAKAAPKAKTKADPQPETPPETTPEPVTTLAIGDKVRINADAKGPNGRKRKCAGREGTLDAISEDGAYYTVRFEPKGSALAIVTNLARDEFDKVEA